MKLSSKWTGLLILCLPLLSLSCSPSTPSVAATVATPNLISQAMEYQRHDMAHEAIGKCIEILYHPASTDTDRAEALYLMGRISFDANNFKLAMSDWQRLTKEYPRSQRAAEVGQRITQLYQAAKAKAAGGQPKAPEAQQ